MKFSAATGDEPSWSFITMVPWSVSMVAVTPLLTGCAGGLAIGVAFGGPPWNGVCFEPLLHASTIRARTVIAATDARERPDKPRPARFMRQPPRPPGNRR